MSSLSENGSSTVIGSEAFQSVALELVIFCATIVVAVVLKVCSFNSGCASGFSKLWPWSARRPPPVKLKKGFPEDHSLHFTTKDASLPSGEDSGAPATRTRRNVNAGARAPLEGSARTIETIMEMANNKNASEALALYADFRSSEDKHIQEDGHTQSWKTSLRMARRSGLDFYSVLVQSAVRVGKPEMVEQLLDDMVSSQIERTLSFYESVMKVLAGKKHYRQALAVYNRLSSEGFKASPVTLSCLINFTAELGDLDSSIKFFEQLDATSKPSIRAYMVALRVHSKRQDWGKSLEIIRSMQARNVPIDSLILNTVLATGVAAGKTEAAEELLHEMAKAAPEVPDVISYNTVLKGYAHQKVADKALKIMELMLSRGVKPNGITFNTVMDAAVRGSQFDDAWKILDLMQEAGIRPDKYTCTILMKGLHENSTPKQLTRLIEMIQSVLPQCDSSLSGALFRGIIQVAARFKNTALLMRAFTQMQGHYVIPTTADYQLMIQTLAENGDKANCSVVWQAVLSSATHGNDAKQSSEAVVVAICKSIMDDLAQKEQVEAMMCAFESLVAVGPATESEKPRSGASGSPKSLESNMPRLLRQCRAALFQAASKKQNTSPAFRRLLELAPDQGVPLETLMKM